MAQEKKLFLIDAFALIFRSYFAFGNNQRYNSKGLNTSVMLGFTNSLLEVLKKHDPSHIAVVFDPPGGNFRNEMYPEYKAHRQETPEDIKSAIPYIYKLVEAFNIKTVCVENYEADDVVGTIAKKAEKEGFTTFMMTPDKDFAQLVSENIFMLRPGRSGKPAEIWGVEQVKEKFEVESPDQVIDILGLWGDSADNIPGIPGIGEKTSKKLIALYKSVEGLIEHAEELKGKQKENVINFAEQGLLSKKLATIALDAPLDFEIDDLIKKDLLQDKVQELFEELEFRTLLRRVLGEDIATPNVANNAPSASIESGQIDMFGGGTGEETVQESIPTDFKTIENTDHNYVLVQTESEIKAMIDDLKSAKEFSFDTETTGIDPIAAEIVGMSFSAKKGTGYYLPIPVGEELRLNQIKDFLESSNQLKIGQNVKYDINILSNYDIEVKGPFFDTMLAHYLIEPDMKHNMDILAETYLNYKPVSIETLIGKKGKNQLSMRDIEVEKVVEYATEDADVTLQLKHALEPELKKRGELDLFYNVEIPLLVVLAKMEQEGVRLDSEALAIFSKELEETIVGLEKSILEEAGIEFNIGSPKQLGEVLFDQLKIDEKAKKTKTGQYATSEDILQKLASKHPIIPLILDFRSLKKLKSTYVDALPEMVNKKTNRIHTNYSQAVAATGRLSSVNPNLQNIPIKTEKGREVRKAFIPSDENHVLLSADYSQVELRLIAELSEDEGMVKAFQEGKDIHAATASKVFDVSIEEVDREMRGKAKMVNFGIIYGISAFGLAQRLNIPRKEAKYIIDQYFAKYPRIKEYMNESVEKAKSQGYVETIMKRKRYLKDINSNNAIVRGYAERNAINAPIQGSAADIIKIAMINIQKEIEAAKLKTKMVLQVHDELVFNTPKGEIEVLEKIVKEGMEGAVETKVPLLVEMSTGNNWLEAH